MLIEYQLPITSKRADVVLAGVDRTGDDAIRRRRTQTVESDAELYEDNEHLVLVEGLNCAATDIRCRKCKGTAITSPPMSAR